MRNRWLTLLIVLCGCTQQKQANEIVCDSARHTGVLPREIAEASGVAISRRNPHILWVHNDDPPAIIYGIDSTGTIKGRIRVPTDEKIDLEDIAVAPCDSGTCLFIGDIGNNAQVLRRRTVYRVPEPLITDTVSATPVEFPFHMPGRAQDAEALFVMPDGHMYIITKGRSGPITVFAFPFPLTPGREVELKPTFDLSGGLVQLPDMVTGAGVTPNGRYIIIRTYSELQLYTLQHDTLKSVLSRPFDLQPLGEPQGEGVDIADDGSIFLVSEEGVSAAAAPVSRVQCHLP